MNKKIYFIITSLFLIFSFNYSFADQHIEKEEVGEAIKLKKIEIGVNGMTCGSCAHDLEKTFSSIPSVKSVEASFADKNVILKLNPNQKLEDSVINKTIEELGYTVTSIKR